jgi:hypothetical protein
METPADVWIAGKIKNIDGTYGGDGAHVGIEELSNFLAAHVGRWARVRVEFIDAPGSRPKSEVIDAELKRMRAHATKVRELLAMLQAFRALPNQSTPEETFLESVAETMLVVCERIEEFYRRLHKLEVRVNEAGPRPKGENG